MKDDLNDEVFDGTPKTLIPFNGVFNWDGVSKSNDKLKGPCYTFLKLDKKPITQSSIWKCSYANDIIKARPMIWVSSIMDGNRQEREQLVIKCNELKQIMPLPKDHFNEFPW